MVVRIESLVFTEVKPGFFIERFSLGFTHETHHLRKRNWGLFLAGVK